MRQICFLSLFCCVSVACIFPRSENTYFLLSRIRRPCPLSYFLVCKNNFRSRARQCACSLFASEGCKCSYEVPIASILPPLGVSTQNTFKRFEIQLHNYFHSTFAPNFVRNRVSASDLSLCSIFVTTTSLVAEILVAIEPPSKVRPWPQGLRKIAGICHLAGHCRRRPTLSQSDVGFSGMARSMHELHPFTTVRLHQPSSDCRCQGTPLRSPLSRGVDFNALPHEFQRRPEEQPWQEKCKNLCCLLRALLRSDCWLTVLQTLKTCAWRSCKGRSAMSFDGIATRLQSSRPLWRIAR